MLGKLESGTELIPVMNSGSDVTDAISRIPTQVLPMPVFSAILSPYLESLLPSENDHLTTSIMRSRSMLSKHTAAASDVC